MSWRKRCEQNSVHYVTCMFNWFVLPQTYWESQRSVLRSDECYLYSFTFSFYPATPADVSLLMQLGVDGVFVGSGIFKSSSPEKRAKAMVQAVTHYTDPSILAKVSEDLGDPMVSI